MVCRTRRTGGFYSLHFQKRIADLSRVCADWYLIRSIRDSDASIIGQFPPVALSISRLGDVLTSGGVSRNADLSRLNDLEIAYELIEVARRISLARKDPIEPD